MAKITARAWMSFMAAMGLLLLGAAPLPAPLSSIPPVFSVERVFGGAGGQVGKDVTFGAGGLYIAGTDTINSGDGMAMRYAVPPGAGPVWSSLFPFAGGGDNFEGVAVSSEGAYFVGSGFLTTSDTIGGKENKGITVKFGLGGGVIMAPQTPPPPGAFPLYGGSEGANDVAVQFEAGIWYAYVTGQAQNSGINGGRTYLSKMRMDGAHIWTRTDSAIVPYSQGLGVDVLGGDIYVAGLNVDDGTMRPLLKKYDAAGTLIWEKRTIVDFPFSGNFQDVVAIGGSLYAVGTVGGDYLIERYEVGGTRTWTRSFDGGSVADTLTSIVGLNGRLYGVGYTTGATTGVDGVVAEFDPATGDLLSTTSHGAVLPAVDQRFFGAATDGTDLYAVGSTGAAGVEDLILVRYTFVLNSPPVAAVGPAATVVVNQSYSGSVSWVDGDSTSWDVVVDFGDGSPNLVVNGLGSSPLNFSHAYASTAGSPYTITATVTDNQGASDPDTVQVVVITAQQGITNIKTDLGTKTLAARYKTVLNPILDRAIARINEGRPEAAVTLLRSFVAYVARYDAAGYFIPAGSGTSLITAANIIIASLTP